LGFDLSADFAVQPALSLAFVFAAFLPEEVALYYDLNFRLSFNSRNSAEPHLHLPSFGSFCGAAAGKDDAV